MKNWQIMVVVGVIVALLPLLWTQPKVEEAGFMEVARNGAIVIKLSEDTDSLKCAAQKMANGVKELVGSDEANAEDACGKSVEIPYMLTLLLGVALVIAGIVSNRRA
jgi:hypothetical protein